MLLNELNKPKITPALQKATLNYFKKGAGQDTIAEELLQINLKKLGWKILDNNGMYSGVYYNPRKSYVLKINKREDYAYQFYVNLIHRHPNKHFPIISDMKVMKIGNFNYRVYLIEKLHRLPRAGILVIKLDELYYGLKNVSKEHIAQRVKELFPRTPAIFKDAEFVNAVWELSWSGGGFRTSWDMHEDNIMQREDGTIVIIDPYS